MPTRSRVIASGGEWVSGVPIKSVQATGVALAHMLRRGGQPAITPRQTPSISVRPPDPPPPPQYVQPTRRVQQMTGAEIASLLRTGGVPVKTTTTQPPAPFPAQPGAGRPTYPPREPQFIQPSTISQPMTGAEIVSMLREGGVPASTRTTETIIIAGPLEYPAVAGTSQDDPRAALFSPPVVSEPLTGAQLKQIGVPVRVEPTAFGKPAPTLPPFTITPIPEDAKKKPIKTGVTTGGAPAVEGVPWSTQASIPSVALESSGDPYGGIFT